MSTILLTGATGFIGSRTAKKLAETGYKLKLFIRDPSRLPNDLQGVSFTKGDLTDSEAIRAAAESVDIVVHCAALTRARSSKEFFTVNRDATLRLYREVAQRSPSCRRFIFISSQAAAGPSLNKEPRRESDPMNPLSPYGESKRQAEEQLFQEDGPAVTALRLSAVYGPGDKELLPFFRAASRGIVPLPSRPDAKIQLLHVDDAVDALISSVESEAEGPFFIAHPEVFTYRELVAHLGSAAGRKPLLLPLPAFIVHTAAHINSSLAWTFCKSAIFNPGKARELRADSWTCCTKAAQDMLNFSPRIDFQRGAISTVAWYRNKQWMK